MTRNEAGWDRGLRVIGGAGTMRSDGVDTLTESDSPDVARLIQTHVAAMYARVDTGRPFHMRSPRTPLRSTCGRNEMMRDHPAPERPR